MGRSPAAVFVITQEMIRRSGARSIPELLRMVPGLHVARIDANKWSVSSRGFSSRFARKLLVQIDGRMAYTQLFSGTLWDIQDVLLDDIERIEVIRGPGATMWGANAVNGIVNVITKSARDTHGVYAEGGGGTEERGFAGARVGGVTPNCVHWRVSTKWFDRDRQFEPNGLAEDDWRQGRVAFRADWEPNGSNAYTFQGDLYTGESGMVNDQPFVGLTAGDQTASGGNLLGRWTRTFGEQSDMSLQVYYDRIDLQMFSFDVNLNIFDVDFQRRLPLNDWNKLIWGLGYRRIWDDLRNTGTPVILSAVPPARTIDLVSAFIQDEMTLVEDSLYFTIGAKISDNTYTDFEVQPTARMLWLPDRRSAVWASVSRAVRIPSRMEREGRIVLGDIGGVVPITVFGSPNVDSEETIAYEFGYRRQPVEWFSWDLAFFYNVDQDLVTSRATLPAFPPTFESFNGQSAEARGVEIAGQVDVSECWKISAWYAYLDLEVQA
ncbi:MAG: TonB-dependent receptor plug domain-containing protein, partial [Planctomycetota bacterium]